MAYGESNGHVTDDVTLPRKVKLGTPIRNSSTITKTAGDAFYRAMHFSAKRGIAIACRLSVCLSVCNVGEL